MLQGDLWIKRLAAEANIELETSLQLWLAFSRSFIHRLEQGDYFDLDALGYWSLCLSDEYLVGEEAPAYIMPPALSISIDSEVNTESYRLDSLAPALEMETGVRLEAVERWLYAIVPLTLRLLDAGYEVVWSGIGSWAKQDSLIFSVDKELSNTINKPFACFTPELLKSNEDLPPLKYRAISIDKALELSPIILAQAPMQAVAAEEIVEPTTEEYTPVAEPIEEEHEGVETEEEATTAEDEPKEEEEIIPVVSDEEPENSEPKEGETIEKTPKKQRGGLIALILALVALALVASFFFTPSCSRKSDKEQPQATALAQIDTTESEASQAIDTVTESLAIVPQEVLAEPQTLPIDTASTRQATAKPKAEVSKAAEPSKPAKASETEATASPTKTNLGNKPNEAEDIILQADESLASLAKEKYGHRAFWVYIYEENRELIANPHSVPIGTKLHLPPANKYGIDAKNTKSVDQALILSRSL